MSEETLICPSCEHTQVDSEAIFCAKCRFPLMLIAGKYRLIRKLGEGGFGYVYLARHIRLQKESERVIKIIKPEIFAQDPSIKLRFEREVQMTALLSQKCQHIVRIHDDFGEIPELGHFYVMEYLQGQPITAFISDPENLPDIRWCVHIFAQLCDAMRRAHEDGIIHRDLKPDNLMLISYGDEPHFLKVLDFGIAKPTEEQGGPLVTQGFVGTPVYMAPELFSEDQSTDFRVDIYAMSIILYEMMVGRPPFLAEGHARTSFFQMLNSHITEAPPSLREMRPDRNIPIALEEVIIRGLNKDPEQRYSSVMEFKKMVLEAAKQTNQEPPASSFTAPIPSPPTPIPSPSAPSKAHSGEVVISAPGSQLSPHSSSDNMHAVRSQGQLPAVLGALGKPIGTTEGTAVRPSLWHDPKKQQNPAHTPLPSAASLLAPQSLSQTPLPQAPSNLPTPLPFPTGDFSLPMTPSTSQELPQQAQSQSLSISKQNSTAPTRSKSRTLALTILGIFGGLTLGLVLIFLSHLKSTNDQTPNERSRTIARLPALPQRVRKKPTKPVIPVYNPVLPTPLPRTPRKHSVRRKHAHRRRRRNKNRSLRLSSNQSCNRPPRGMGWSQIQINPRRTRIFIIKGQGKVQKTRKSRTFCLWFKGHRVQIKLQAPRYKDCVFWVYRLHRRVRTLLERGQSSQDLNRMSYCRKL